MIFQSIFDPVTKNTVGMDHGQLSTEVALDTELPPLQRPDPSLFDGMGDVWKAIPNAAMDMASAAITSISQIPIENLSTRPETREWLRKQREDVMPENARSIRKIARSYELDPQTAGMASQVVYGLTEMIPKATLYASVAGPAGGSLLFGAEAGINRTQELIDDGVDSDTAVDAGVLTFAMQSIGLRLPAAFETAKRLTSAGIGAGANAGLNVAEIAGVHWILENQDYRDLAQRYQLNAADTLISAGVGGFFGGAFWRSRASRFSQARDDLSQHYENDLMKTGKFTAEQARAQANLNATAVASFANRSGLSPDQVSKFAPRLVVDGKTANDGFEMPITQGIEWHMGVTKLSPDALVPVVQYKGQATDRKTAINQILSVAKAGTRNEETGFVLTIGKTDLSKSAGGLFSYNERVLRAVAPVFSEIVAKAKRLESHVDVDHNNDHVQGIHRFATPVEIDGNLFRVCIVVRDYIIPGQERLAAHTIAGVKIYEIENPPASKVADGGSSDILTDTAPTIRLSATETNQDHVISLSKLVGGRRPYERVDGRFLFDPVDDSQLKEGGVYYESPELNQEATHASRGSYSPDKNLITLTPNADVTTFSHETGHWYLDNLFHAYGAKGVDASVREDVEALLRFFGVDSVETWHALGIDGQRKYHEMFASLVEKYLSDGKSPTQSLAGVLKRFAEWIKDLYVDWNGGATEAIDARFKGMFGQELPPLSPDVRKIIDRMYREDFGPRRPRPTKIQVAAARAVQLEEINKEKRSRVISDTSESAYSKAQEAQRKAVDDINSGTSVDVSAQMQGVSVNTGVVEAAQRSFARTMMAGSGENAIVLQNRDRNTVASVGQINAIASNPLYPLLSFSRNTSSGAPIVSFGTMPDDSHIGIRDAVTDTTGEQIPVVYAVVEASEVQTSNAFDGSPNPNYANPEMTQAVAGNGRLTGLAEAYRRGTADGYKRELMSDSVHGVNPAVIASMKHPVLVRFMPPEKVTTGFVSRSNVDQVMSRSNVEKAVEDASKIRSNIASYRFDEDGVPTTDTVRQFIIDVGEPNALGTLITRSGEPTPAAVDRIRFAAFQEAYQSEPLTELFASTIDVNVKRLLTAAAAFAPRVVEIREASGNSIELGRAIVHAVNEIRNARTAGRKLDTLVGQGSFLGDPAYGQFVEMMVRNVNSAAAIGRILNPLADWIMNAMRANDGGLFGDEAAVTTDMADVLQQMRRIENELLVEAGGRPLPDVDVESIRSSMQSIFESAEVKVQARADALEGVGENADAVKLRQLIEQDPQRVVRFEDDDGSIYELPLSEVENHMKALQEESDVEAAGMAQAAICILKNEGL